MSQAPDNPVPVPGFDLQEVADEARAFLEGAGPPPQPVKLSAALLFALADRLEVAERALEHWDQAGQPRCDDCGRPAAYTDAEDGVLCLQCLEEGPSPDVGDAESLQPTRKVLFEVLEERKRQNRRFGTPSERETRFANAWEVLDTVRGVALASTTPAALEREAKEACQVTDEAFAIMFEELVEAGTAPTQEDRRQELVQLAAAAVMAVERHDVLESRRGQPAAPVKGSPGA